MITLIRKHQPFLMVMITILVIISFVLFYNINRMTGRGTGEAQVLATVYGRNLTEDQVDRFRRKYYLAGELGLYDFLQSLGGSGQKAIENFIFNSLVLDHEADLLQVQPTREEIIAEETDLPVFQTDGAFDRDKLAAFIQDKLAPKGFSETEIDELIGKDLQLKKLKALIGSTVALQPTEVRFAYEVDNRKMDLSVIRFRLADFAAGVQLSEDDLKKAFEARKQDFKSDEKRKIAFVVFSLSDSDKKLEGKEKNEAMGQLANRASDFTEAMTDKGAQFAQVAAKAGAEVRETQPFTEAGPDKQIAGNPAAVHAAFQMTKEDPNSDAIEGPDSFYVLHLEEIIPSQPLTFEQARAQLTEQLKNERAREIMNLKAADVHNKILADLKAGKAFADSTKALGQKVEAIPPFSLAEVTSEKSDLAQIAQKAVDLNTGQLSDFTPTSDGGMILYLDKFEPPDAAAFASEEPVLSRGFLKGKQEIAFHDWLRIQRSAARVHILGAEGT